MEIKTRKQAHEAGEKTFFTNRPCKDGHLSPRYTSTGGCVACLRQFSQQFRASYEGTVQVPTQRMHPDDAEQVLKFIDHLNAARRLPPAIRAADSLRMPTRWEVYLAKEMRRPVGARPSLEDMARAAKLEGIEVSYATMEPPVDTWTRPLRLPDIAARKAEMARSLAAEGYLPDERPTT